MAQTIQIELEYLMTVHADLGPPQLIDTGSRIVNVNGGWADGPKIKAKAIAPGADWLQVLPSGVTRIDVRLTMVTDDEQLIFCQLQRRHRAFRAKRRQDGERHANLSRRRGLLRGRSDFPDRCRKIRVAEPRAGRRQNGAAVI